MSVFLYLFVLFVANFSDKRRLGDDFSHSHKLLLIG